MLLTDGFEVVSDESIEGQAAFVQEHAAEDDEQLATDLRAYVTGAGLPGPSARGPLDPFLRIIHRVRGRTLAQDLGEQQMTIAWLTFHVPQGCKGQLKLTNTGTTEAGLRLGVAGLGFGSARRLALSVNQDFHERTECLQLAQRVRTRVRVFSEPNTASSHVQVDVLELLANQANALVNCPDCTAIATGDTGLMADPGVSVDLRNDPHGQSRTEAVELNDDSEIEFGIPLALAGLAVKPSVSVKRSVRLKCEAQYDFVGGFAYTPFTRLNAWSDLPLWKRS
jgi:hypothetical protein